LHETTLPPFATDAWIGEALRLAYLVASFSLDPSSQCGALLYDRGGDLVAYGCNELAPGMEICDANFERPRKYAVVEHAERLAILRAGMRPVLPYIMVAPWAACADCARATTIVGVSFLIRHGDCMDRPAVRWRESISLADEILEAGACRVHEFRGTLGATPVRMDGELWNP